MVDDEEDLLRSYEQCLSVALPDIEVVALTRAADALARIRDAEPELVITDVRMPEMNGFELLSAARAQWPSLPFIVMTAFTSESIEHQAKRLDAVHYLEKPFPVAKLTAIAREVLARQRTPEFAGALSTATLPDLLQLYFMSASTGALRVWRESRTASIWFDRGSIVHAVAGALEGRDAVFEVVSWDRGQYTMHLNIAAPARSVADGTTGALLELARRKPSP